MTSYATATRNNYKYRTKRFTREIYDAMARAMQTGDPYRTRLNPPPGHPSQTHTGPVPEWVEIIQQTV